MRPIFIPYISLIMDEKSFSHIINSAFDKNSLGLIIITDVPNMKEFRTNLIQAGRNFIKIKDKSKYEKPEAYYAVGWSYGKEKMKNNKLDFAKGSYYANPLEDNPTDDKELIKKYPGSYTPNVWIDDIPEFEESFKIIGKTIYFLGLLLLNHCDDYLKKKGIKSNLEKLISGSRTCKGRFLHYFEIDKEKNKEDDGSCGWHCDSGCLTGLISAKYFDKNKEVKSPKDAGLFIKDRNNNLVKVDIPEDAIAFQIGEIIQILSGGEIIATPHCVKSSKELYSRNTFALFMDVHPNYKINIPEISKDKKEEILTIKNLPEGVPLLKDRYYDGITYGEFLDKTYKAYYN